MVWRLRMRRLWEEKITRFLWLQVFQSSLESGDAGSDKGVDGDSHTEVPEEFVGRMENSRDIKVRPELSVLEDIDRE